jgi:hypothetical protein
VFEEFYRATEFKARVFQEKNRLMSQMPALADIIQAA